MQEDNKKEKGKRSLLKEYLFYFLGVILIGGYTVLYFYRLLNLHPDTLPEKVSHLVHSLNPGSLTMFIINSLIFVLFLLFIPYREKIEWKSKGVFSAFIVALFAEMFGLPLLLFITSPFFSGEAVPVNIPLIGKIYLFRHYFFFGWTGTVIGSYLTLTGMILVFLGWYRIHKATGLVDSGIYRYIRHPQYTGLFLIMTGWMLHWATTLTLFMYPVLLVIYYRLSIREEKMLLEEFGERFLAYKERSWMFFPLPLRLKKKKG